MNEKKENNLHKFVIFPILVILILCVSGCVNEDGDNQQLSVLVTIVPQQEMVEEIGGDFVDVTVMVPAGQSPHSFEPDPQQMKNVVKARAYFTVGSGVEFEIVHMETIIENNPDIQVFDCSENISVISFDEHYGKEAYHQNDTDHHHDLETENTNNHDHSGTDPHIWTSPENVKKMAEIVYEGLVEIDKDHQQQYHENYQNFISEIEMLHQNISSILAPYEGRSFMVYHPSWGYFGDTYNLEQIAIEDEGKEPGPSGLAAIIEQASNESIQVIFVSPQFDTSRAQTIADEINGEVVSADPLTSNFKNTIQNLAETIVKGYSSNN